MAKFKGIGKKKGVKAAPKLTPGTPGPGKIGKKKNPFVGLT